MTTETGAEKENIQENPRIFEGSVIAYAGRISFNGALNYPQVADSLDKIIADGILLQDDFCTFSDRVGLELYSKNCMPSAIECFELAFRQQQLDEENNPIILKYARNFINALASHIYSLANMPEDEKEKRIQNIKWFDSKSEVYQQAVACIDLYKDTEASKTVRETYKFLYDNLMTIYL